MLDEGMKKNLKSSQVPLFLYFCMTDNPEWQDVTALKVRAIMTLQQPSGRKKSAMPLLKGNDRNAT